MPIYLLNSDIIPIFAPNYVILYVKPNNNVSS